MYSRKEKQRPESYKDRALGTLTDGYSMVAQGAQIVDYYFSKNKAQCSGVSTFAILLATKRIGLQGNAAGHAQRRARTRRPYNLPRLNDDHQTRKKPTSMAN